jgi:hypothetical protein
MSNRITPVMVYYSDLKAPIFKGLLTKAVLIDFEAEGNRPIFALKINPQFHLKEIGGSFDHLVARSQTIFEVEQKENFNIGELYEATKRAVADLNQFVEKSNLESSLKDVQPPPLSAVLASLNAIIERFRIQK